MRQCSLALFVCVAPLLRCRADASMPVLASVRLHREHAATLAEDEGMSITAPVDVVAAAPTKESLAKHLPDKSNRLTFGQCATVTLLFLFAVLNGVARRSLSSAAPSMVAKGFITVERLEEVFTFGFKSFALGRLLAVPTMLIGTKRAIMLQMSMITLSSAAYFLAADQPRVQLGAWAVLRVFSAMALSTALPFVGAWFPRHMYGRVWALINSGFQVGYLLCSYWFQALLFSHRGLDYRLPFGLCALSGFALMAACAFGLKEKAPAAVRTPVAAGKVGSEAATQRSAPIRVRLLLKKMWTRWVFWAMIIACASYSPLVEFGTHVTSYLKDMRVSDPVHPSEAQGFVCLQSKLCEGRYRSYVFSYLSALLLGSVVYDRATQLDKALLVAGLYTVNVACWTGLALSEPSQPPVKVSPPAHASVFSQLLGGSWISKLVSQQSTFTARYAASNGAASGRDTWFLPLSPGAKTVLASVAGATIALPSSLPFALFALDFGKEGAALLSSVLSAVGCLVSLAFLQLFPTIVRRRGWFGVHATLATMSGLSGLSMGTLMFADQRKFSRGYIIRSSLVNSTVVTLHACSRQSCSGNPMWRPGARRVWGEVTGRHPPWQLHAPNSRCHMCGYRQLVECKVEEAAAELALITPFEKCGRWVLAQNPLRKPVGGWAFSDPMRYPLAPDTTYGDRRSYERRLQRALPPETSSKPPHYQETPQGPAVEASGSEAPTEGSLVVASNHP